MSGIGYDLDSDNKAQGMAEAEPTHSNENRSMEVKAKLKLRNSLKISRLMNITSQSCFTLREARTNFFSRMLQELTRGPKVGAGGKGREVSHPTKESPLLLFKLFRQAFTSGFREATERTIRLPECSDMALKMTVL
jgi:hypothetical protein